MHDLGVHKWKGNPEAETHSNPRIPYSCHVSAKDPFAQSKLETLCNMQATGGIERPWHWRPARPRELSELGLGAIKVLVQQVLAAFAGHIAAKAQTAASHQAGL